MFFLKDLLEKWKKSCIVLVLLGWVCAVDGADPDRETLAKRAVERQPAAVSEVPKTENIQNSEDAQKARPEQDSKRLESQLRAEIARLNRELIREKSVHEAEKAKLLSELSRKRNESPMPADEETEVLRKELIETLKRSSASLDRLKILELSAASVMDTLEPVYMTAREVEMAETLELVLTTGSKLAAKSAMVSEKILAILPGIKLGNVEQAKLKVMLEELWQLSGSFAKLNLPPGKPEGFEHCRVLAVNETLGIVILSAGYRNGVRVNLTLTAENDRKTGLKVIALRSFVSAAMVETGSLKDLVPGMKVTAVKR